MRNFPFPWDRIGVHILFLFDEGLLYAEAQK